MTDSALGPTLSTARGKIEILEAVSRWCWDDVHGAESDCPADAIATYDALATWDWPDDAVHEVSSRLTDCLEGALLLLDRSVDGGRVKRRLERYDRAVGATRAWSSDPRGALFPWSDLANINILIGTAIVHVHRLWLSLPKHDRSLLPLAPVVSAWQKCRPPAVDPNLDTTRPRIIPSRLAMFDSQSGDARGRLFSRPAHVVTRHGVQLVLPGFEVDGNRTPALPLALYELGAMPGASGSGAPLALRLFVEAILAVRLEDRGAGPVAMEIPLRDLLKRLWPGRRARPHEYMPALERAREALSSRDAGIPWDGGIRWPVTMTNFPQGLDDAVRLVVDLPPGAQHGPQVSRRLHLYGPKKGRAYRALLNLAYLWHEPGRTLVPSGRGWHWLRVTDARRYRTLSDAELVNLVFPTSARGARRNLVHGAGRVIKTLEHDNELRIVDGRILPPVPGAESDVRPCRE